MRAGAQPNNLTNEVIGITFMSIVFFASIVVFIAFTDNVLIAFMHGGESRFFGGMFFARWGRVCAIDAAGVIASQVRLRSFAFKYARNVFAVCLLRALYNGCMCTQFLRACAQVWPGGQVA